MGYWADTDTMVITKCIGPGPEGAHTHTSFTPDHTWQEKEVAEHYGKTGRVETYLGDWHIHPRQDVGRMSWKDRRTAFRIATSQTARANRPLMALLHGDLEDLRLAVWIAEVTQISKVTKMATLTRAQLQLEK